jgi:hypothetical protein
MFDVKQPIGYCVFSIRVPGEAEVDPTSEPAILAGVVLADDLETRIRRAISRGQMPDYRVRCHLDRLESGSLLSYIGLTADVVDLVSTTLAGAGLFKFCKDYPALKKGVLEIARDVEDMKSSLLSHFGGKLPVSLKSQYLVDEQELLRSVEAALAEAAERRRRAVDEEQEKAAFIRRLSQSSQSNTTHQHHDRNKKSDSSG